MKILIIAHILVMLAMGFMRWKNEDHDLRKWMWPALILKVTAGIGLGLLYTFYYDVGDTFGYFDDAVKLNELARTDFGNYLNFLWISDESHGIWSSLNFHQPRALFLAKLTSLVSLITVENYWVVSAYFSFISFWGAWFLVRQIKQEYPNVWPVSALAFLFFPSVVFWTSGLIKESIAMACLYFLALIFIKLWKASKVSLWQWLLVPFTMWIIWNLKYYYFAVFISVAATALVMRLFVQPFFKLRNNLVTVLAWVVVFLVPLFVVGVVHPNFYPGHFLEVIVSNYEAFVSISEPGDMISYADLEPTVGSILYYSPKALLSALFRPFLWEAHTVFQLVIAFENFFLAITFTMSVIQFKRNVQSCDLILWLSLVVYIVLLSVFLALSTPNFGTLSRYRVCFLPFFILLVGYNNPIMIGADRFLRRSFSRLVE
jgi:hypothetical protein